MSAFWPKAGGFTAATVLVAAGMNGVMYHAVRKDIDSVRREVDSVRRDVESVRRGVADLRKDVRDMRKEIKTRGTNRPWSWPQNCGASLI